LHKTDYDYDDLQAKQAFHHSLSSWLPYFGAPVAPADAVDTYAFRSALAPMTALGYDLRRRDIDWRPLKELTEEWRCVFGTGCFYGDYYPLTTHNRQLDRWIAWQFNRPEQGDGTIQAFRREECDEPAKSFRLGGLDLIAQYDVRNLDVDGSTRISGKDLMENGLAVEITDKPGAAVILYQRVG
ncbi:MAG: GH36 C-terminal domain-containing protein, partial [Anaerolineae bacterium]|nr:GH36 C-terminal domain-containing protein [Anaerolineae bacterium]